jgi:hypothetical protein
MHRISSTLSISRTPARALGGLRVELIFFVLWAFWKFYTNDVVDASTALQTPMFDARAFLYRGATPTLFLHAAHGERSWSRHRRAFVRNV